MSNLLEKGEIGEVSLIAIENIQPQEKTSVALALDSSVAYDYIFYDTDGDESANVGSIVAIKCEQGDSESDNVYEYEEVIMQDIPEQMVVVPISIEPNEVPNPNTPSLKWPHLEIMPGGVIKNANIFESQSKSKEIQEKALDSDNMQFECAKCSQQFQYLSSLVEHVKSHKPKRLNYLRNQKHNPVSALGHDYIFLRTKKGLVFQKAKDLKS